MTLAAERTYLAYLRTGLALLAAGVAVATALPDAGSSGLRVGLGCLLVLLGLAVTLGAYGRYVQVDRAMRAGAPLPKVRLALPLTLGLAVVAVGGLVVVLRS
jgi:putative membrane protein